jgi:hypothetical protein
MIKILGVAKVFAKIVNITFFPAYGSEARYATKTEPITTWANRTELDTHLLGYPPSCKLRKYAYWSPNFTHNELAEGGRSVNK